ncbi:DUF5655 domain-containing protein [Ancylomarina sp.]|uniref:DUF5655 domain-containing protein n=1 Tax=Ancylomarina sp. TaxID=1970196 RepID=UPI00356B150E
MNKTYHTKKMNEKVQIVFEALLSHIENFEAIDVIFLKTCVQINTNSTFLSITTKRDRLELEFQLDREDDFFPIFLCQRISKNRVLHRITLSELSEFDNQVKIWIRDSYELINKR